VIGLIPESLYESEVNRWVTQFTLFTVLSLAAGWFFAWVIWRTLYRPLRNLSQDIRDVKNNRWLASAPRKSNNLEFDIIHGEFEHMRRQIGELIGEIGQKEKRRAELEIEKLMHQINPHFLYNTLDTVRWIARANGQAEIDRLIFALNKVLHYNLGKSGRASIRDELDALKQYVMLQGIRYNFKFDVRVHADDLVLDLPIPRFILQPLVENALYHGLDENGLIEVVISKEREDLLLIQVKDSGQGMTEEEIADLLGGPDKKGKVGLGIGLQYVIRMLAFQFGPEAGLHIESVPGQGTTIILRLPVTKKE